MSYTRASTLTTQLAYALFNFETLTYMIGTLISMKGIHQI
jgi:hypothetical protein